MNQNVLKEQRVRLHALLMAFGIIEAELKQIDPPMQFPRYLALARTNAELLRMRIGKLLQLLGVGSPYTQGYDKDSKIIEPLADPAEKPYDFKATDAIGMIKEFRSEFAQVKQALRDATMNSGMPVGLDINVHFTMFHAFAMQILCDDITNWLGCQLGEFARVPVPPQGNPVEPKLTGLKFASQMYATGNQDEYAVKLAIEPEGARIPLGMGLIIGTGKEVASLEWINDNEGLDVDKVFTFLQINPEMQFEIAGINPSAVIKIETDNIVSVEGVKVVDSRNIKEGPASEKQVEQPVSEQQSEADPNANNNSTTTDQQNNTTTAAGPGNAETPAEEQKAGGNPN